MEKNQIELFVYEKYIRNILFEENGEKKVSYEDIENMKLSGPEKKFVLYVINKRKIKLVHAGIRRSDRSSKVGDNNYGDIQTNELQKQDEPVMSELEYSSANDRVYTDFSKLDEYLETKFIPNYVSLKIKKRENGEVEEYPSIRLSNILSLRLSEEEFKHVMDYLNEQNIHVVGKGAPVDGEFENYDFVSTYKESALPLSVPAHVTLEKIKLYRENPSEELKEEIIRDNMRLVPFVAYKYAIATGINIHELESYGYEGLVLALEKFDINSVYLFSTYAIARIKWCILDGINEISMGKKDNFYYNFVNAKAAVENANGSTLIESPELIDEVIELLIATGKLSDKESSVEYAKRKINRLLKDDVSLDDTEMVDSLIDNGELIYNEDYDDIVLKSMSRDSINEVLKTLTQREQDILRLRFGFDDGNCRTMDEIGKMMGCTGSRIRQIIERALRKLRHPSRSKKIK